jgi:hypothetical protein
MTLPNEVNPLLRVTASTAYTINNSLRFRSSASAYLSRTPASASNQTVWTISVWVKRGTLGSLQTVFDAYTNGSNSSTINFTSSDQIQVSNYVAGSLVTNKVSSSVYRDPSSWYHIVVASNGATSLNIYVNGVQVTSFATNTGPTSANWFFNGANAHRIATEASGGSTTQLFDGYLAEVNFIDGQALTPSSFGAYNSFGVWQPVRYTGTYGTNGFYLKFASTGSTAALGTDSSGNGNTWTVNNISVTAGTTYDPMLDSPTLTSATVANYPVMNPLCVIPYSSGSGNTSNGNLTATATSGAVSYWGSMKFSSGLWYWEVTATTINGGYPIVGVQFLITSSGGVAGNGQYSYGQDGYYYFNGSNSSGHGTFTTGDIIMVAYNATNGKLWFGKNGTWNASGDPAAGTNPAMTVTVGLADNYPFVMNYISSVTNSNFGQRAFAYTAPTGFVALNAYNLATPTIANGLTGMGVTLYTGNGGNTNSIPHGLPFTPNLVWQKSRASASFGGNNHQIYDSVRGFGSGKELASNSTASEGNTGGATYGILSSVDSTYLNAALGTSGSQTWNQSGITYVVWEWLAGASSGSNTAGSITSTVSVNATAGFSVVTYTGTGANATVGHGLGVAPSMVIIKDRVQGSAAYHWFVYLSSLGAGQRLLLNTTGAASADTNYFNNTSPTSSVFSLGNATPQVNASGDTYVAYCWSAVAGYSAFGSYTGNGSADGPFVYTGFRPRWIMIKSTGGADWYMWDSSRNAYNQVADMLRPNLSAAELNSSTYVFDFVSNGFKVRGAGGEINTSGGTYIYAAFAENPFKYALAR